MWLRVGKRGNLTFPFTELWSLKVHEPGKEMSIVTISKPLIWHGSSCFYSGNAQVTFLFAFCGLLNEDISVQAIYIHIYIYTYIYIHTYVLQMFSYVTWLDCQFLSFPCWQCQNKATGNKPVPVSLCWPQIPYEYEPGNYEKITDRSCL